MSITYHELELSDGEVIKVAVERVPGQGQEVTRSGRKTVRGKLDESLSRVKTIAKDLKTALNEAKPDKTKVEFGVDFSVEASGLSALIAKGSAKASFKITLEWNKEE